MGIEPTFQNFVDSRSTYMARPRLRLLPLDGRVRGLAGFAEPSAVVGDDPMARLQKDRKLLLPRSAAQRISVDQNHGVTGAVIFVIELDVTRVFFPDCNDGMTALLSFALNCARLTSLPKQRAPDRS
jgi:hypothetical protein